MNECGREHDLDPSSLPLPGETPVMYNLRHQRTDPVNCWSDKDVETGVAHDAIAPFVAAGTVRCGAGAIFTFGLARPSPPRLDQRTLLAKSTAGDADT